MYLKSYVCTNCSSATIIMHCVVVVVVWLAFLCLITGEQAPLHTLWCHRGPLNEYKPWKLEVQFFFSSKWSRWIITSALQKQAFILCNDQIYVEAISLLFYWNSIKNPVRGNRILWFQLLWLDVSNTVITLNLYVCVGGWWVGCTFNCLTITKCN